MRLRNKSIWYGGAAAFLVGAAVWLSVLILRDDAPSHTVVFEGRTPQQQSIESVAIPKIQENTDVEEKPSLAERLLPFRARTPRAWGEHLAGVLDRVPSDARVIALTFDACGGAIETARGNGYDALLIDALRREHIPATLFVNSRWIDAHPDLFAELAHDPLFEIENHGTAHVPCSVSGQSAYGIVGTTSVSAAAHEIDDNAQKIARITGRVPRFYRPGTAYTDDVCVDIAQTLGYTIAGYSLLGDAGATATAQEVTRALVSAQPGDIALLHMNRPAGETAEGVITAIPLLRAAGFQFVRLEDVMAK